MNLVPVQSLKIGRILAADVRNAHGQLLIKKAVEVSERHLRMLKSWGIVEVPVEGDNDETAETVRQYDPETLEQARSDVMERMKHNTIEHPAIDELVRLCVLRRAEELHRQHSPAKVG